jgi:hypothetical protein
MRIEKTDRGYIDMDHVLAVGEPYYYSQGMYGFDVTMMFLDSPLQMLYYAKEFGLVFHQAAEGSSRLEDILDRLRKDKIEPFVDLWSGRLPKEPPPGA